MSIHISKLNELIVKQQLEIKSLKEKIEYLEDSVSKRQQWLSKAKREAGFNDSVSFDVVWETVLKTFKQ